jgi:hypothetical protein
MATDTMKEAEQVEEALQHPTPASSGATASGSATVKTCLKRPRKCSLQP